MLIRVFKIIRKITGRWVWSGLELNSAADWPSRERFVEPWARVWLLLKQKTNHDLSFEQEDQDINRFSQHLKDFEKSFLLYTYLFQVFPTVSTAVFLSWSVLCSGCSRKRSFPRWMWAAGRAGKPWRASSVSGRLNPETSAQHHVPWETQAVEQGNKVNRHPQSNLWPNSQTVPLLTGPVLLSGPF